MLSPTTVVHSADCLNLAQVALFILRGSGARLGYGSRSLAAGEATAVAGAPRREEGGRCRSRQRSRSSGSSEYKTRKAVARARPAMMAQTGTVKVPENRAILATQNAQCRKKNK